MTKLSRTVALALLAIIVFATLSPIQMRPHIAEATVERALAYVLLGFALAFGFPNRLYQAAIFVVAAAGILELLQIIDPGRHAHVADALVKACAGTVGILVGQFFVRSRRGAGAAENRRDDAARTWFRSRLGGRDLHIVDQPGLAEPGGRE